MFDRNVVIGIALAEVGYHEKASPADLDSKTGNSGSANYTKYAGDLDAISGFYNGNKNGYAWCDVFVDWCFVTAYGAEAAKQLLCQPSNSCGAACTYSANYYKQKNQYYKSNPHPGDQIFFGNDAESTHTGIVYQIDSSKVYTVEGNSSDGVNKRSYALNNSWICGYGRPDYDDNWEPTSSSTGSTTLQEISDAATAQIYEGNIDTIAEVQIWLNNDYSAGLSIDGLYGSATKAALIKGLQKATGLEADGTFSYELYSACSNLDLKKGSSGEAVKILQGFLVCYGYKAAFVDGEFGIGTRASLLAFQRKYKLEVDGIAAQEVFSFLCR